MPVFIEDGITLTLCNGDTVTLYERSLTVDDRRNNTKRATVISHSLAYKQKQAESLDKKSSGIEADAELNGEREAKLIEIAEEAGELIASVDLVELYAEMLARRFESWDVFVTKADQEANNPLPLKKDIIVEFCAKPRRAALIAEIVTLLGEYDKREGKDIGTLQENSGERFKTEVQTAQ